MARKTEINREFKPRKPEPKRPTTTEELYQDLPLKEQPKDIFPDKTQICGGCEGHGGMNDTLDAYGPGKHFQCFCSNCNGWGWVKPCDHVHEWYEISPEASRMRGIPHWGMCYHVHLCKHPGCNEIWITDSSD